MEETLTFFKQLFERFKRAEVLGLSAQLAYFFLLSLFPFLLFIVTLLGYLPIDDRLLVDILSEYLPSEVVAMVDENVTVLLNSRSGGVLSISIIGTLWSASNGFNALTRSFNKAYDVEKKRNFLLGRIVAIGLMLSMIVAIVFALLIPVLGKVIGEYVFSFFALSHEFVDVWNTFRWVMSSVVFFVLFYVLYKLGPNYNVKNNRVIWGTLFTTVAWQLVSFGFSYYVETLGNFSIMHGSLGTVIILMIWFYLSGIIITTGGVINALITEKRIKGVET